MVADVTVVQGSRQQFKPAKDNPSSVSMGIVALIIPQAVLPHEPSVMDHRSLHAQPLFAIEFTVACGGDLLRRIARERVPDAPHRGRAEPASRRSKTSHRPDASRAVGSSADVIRRASDHRNLRSP